MFRLKGKGVNQIRGGSVGDLLCRVIVETPQNLTKNQKTILKDFKSELSNNKKHSPLSFEWFTKVKSFLDGN